jgi:hypothetical protein
LLAGRDTFGQKWERFRKLWALRFCNIGSSKSPTSLSKTIIDSPLSGLARQGRNAPRMGFPASAEHPSKGHKALFFNGFQSLFVFSLQISDPSRDKPSAIRPSVCSDSRSNGRFGEGVSLR